MRHQKNYPLLEQVEVIDVGAKGKNIAKHASPLPSPKVEGEKNLVILVENAVPGDICDIQIYKKKKGLAEGRAVNFHKYSEDRIEPICSHFDNCGGCSRQNINYEKQLFFKQKAVADALIRIGKLTFPQINPIIGSANTEYYRNRLDYAFSSKRWLSQEEMNQENRVDMPGLGFHISGRFDKVLDIAHCYLQEDPSNQIRLAIKEFALANDYTFFDLRNQTGSLRSLIIRTSSTGDIMVILIFYKEEQTRINQMMDFIKTSFPAISSLYYVINPKANDTVYDQEHVLYSGSKHLRENYGGLVFSAGPKSFFQTNSAQAEVLYCTALQMAELKPDDVVYDLYTGVGSIALQASQHCKKVIGIETVAEAIEYAKQNAADNSIKNAEFFAGDVRDVLNDEFIAHHGRPDVIITDPPRNGMDLPVVNKILEIAPQKIVYISCNPATQARDLELMKAQYEIKAVQPVDMFPHTWHVENIVVLERV